MRGIYTICRLPKVRTIKTLKSDEEYNAIIGILWSDPRPIKGYHISRRGIGVEFGADVRYVIAKEKT
jgi:hypothetical protein